MTIDTLNACCEVCGKYGQAQCATCPIESQRQALVNEAMKERVTAADKRMGA